MLKAFTRDKSSQSHKHNTIKVTEHAEGSEFQTEACRVPQGHTHQQKHLCCHQQLYLTLKHPSHHLFIHYEEQSLFLMCQQTIRIKNLKIYQLS